MLSTLGRGGRRLWGSALPLTVFFTLFTGLFVPSATGQTLYNGITLPQPWPPPQTPTQADPVPTYITSPPAVIPIDLGRQLFVDNFLILQTTMTQTQHQVIMYPPNPIIVPGPSDYGYLMPYGGGEWFDPSDQLYKLWLYCGGATLSGVCYEYSTDGKNWTRPSYPDVLVPNTDIVLNEGLSVWMDLQDIPARKFKAFEYVPNATYQVLYYYSADGIHWTSTTDTQYPIPLVYDKTSFFWNPFRSVWVDSLKNYLTLPAAPTRAAYLTRARNYSESPDLMNWNPGEPANPSDPNLLADSYWTGPTVDDPPYVPGGVPPQLYNLDAVAYESLMVGMFGWFYPGPAENDPNDLPGPDIVEMGVGFSRDGFQWVRPTRGSGPGPNGAFIPATNVLGTWDMGNTQGAAGCFMVVGDELWFYFSGRSGPHADPNVTGATGLATLRRDGFYSMDAGATPASLTTRPVQFSGNYMFVNVNDPQGSLTIQVLNPTTGAVLANSQPISVNKTLQAVSWTNGVADLTQWENEPVEFQFNMTNGELYSFWVTSSAAGASNGYVAAGGPGFTGLTDTQGSAAYPTTVATPEISPYGAVFANSVSVTIFTGTLGATIYYTLDGSTPTTSSAIYTGPLQLTATATVSAIAAAPGMTTSGAASASFILDNSPPSVSITSLANNQTVSANVNVSATALDSVGVASVEFLIDGNPIGTATSAPYTVTLETTTVTNASHQLTAIATDLAGNQGTSQPVTINVQNVSSGPSTGLVGYWSFDAAYVSGSTAFDQSGNNNNAALSFTIPVPGAVNQAMQFNGSSSYAQVGPATTPYDLNGSLSLSLWIQTTNASRDEALISKYISTGTGLGYLLRTTPGGTAELLLGGANVASGAAVSTDTTKINDGNWHHLLVVINLGSSVSFYVDGAFSSTEAINSTASAAATPLEMGVSASSAAANYFTGIMDEVRVYNVALGASDALSLAGPVLLLPSSVNLNQNQQQQFSAVVHGVAIQGVTWLLNPNSGTISASGVYTAPAGVANGQSVSVTATSTAYASDSGVATVNFTTGAAVNFLGADTVTEGNWEGVYGLDGYSVATVSQSSPPYASFAVENDETWVWAASTLDPRALQTGSGRIAAAWWNIASFNFAIDVTDGKQHPVALYLLDFDNKARAETVQVADGNTGAILDTRTISGFGNGIYLIWNISGNVQISITCNGGPNAVVSGLFFGTNRNHAGESVTVSPASATMSAGQTQQFAASVSGATSQQVTWSILSVNPSTAPAGSFASSTSGLYTAPQSGLVPAQVIVQATSADGTASGTATINLTTGAVANFITLDTTTQGNWQKNYGADGYSIAGSLQSLPGYATFSVQGELNWTWAPSTSDVRALIVPGAGGIAAAWYNPTSFTLSVNVGASSHQVAMYLLDWDGKGRSETIQIQDANTGLQLFSQTVSNFGSGVYLVWNITGSMTITVTKAGGPNGVVSGVFWGGAASSSSPPASPALSITKTHAGGFTQGQQGTYTVTVSNAAGVSATSGTVTVAENVPTGETLATITGTGWTCSVSTASCSRSDPLGAGSSYAAITVTVNVAASASSPQVNQVSVSGGGSASANASDSTTISSAGSDPVDNSSATFVASDTTTQGNWMGVYGADGYDVANGPQSPAGGTLSYGSYSVQSQSNWTWAASTTDPRALEIDSNGDRIAATWYNSTTFSFNINFTDTNTHKVALYVLDWDSKGRSETIQVLDASSGAVLNTQTVSNFTNGIYLIWNITGDVTIKIQSTAGPNAVVAGIFFGGTGGTITPPAAATASWVKADTATEGTWMGVYGSQGYSLATAGANIQSFSVPVTFSVVNQSNWAWAASTTDPRALEIDSQGDREAATWYSATSFNLSLNLTDGQTHQVALYVIDWDSKGRTETITIADANTGKILDTRSIPNTNASSASYTNTTSTNFVNGTYLIWNVSGSVTITVAQNSGPNAVVSGVFVDP